MRRARTRLSASSAHPTGRIAWRWLDSGGDGGLKPRRKTNGAGIAADPTLTGGGFPKERFTPGVSLACPKACGAMSPGARAGAGSVGGEVAIRRSIPCRPAVPRPVVVPGFSSGLASPKTCNSSKPGRFVRPCRLRALAVSTLRNLTDPKISHFPLLHPAAFRGRVSSGSKISSFFRVLPLPSEEPIPALDDLKMRRSGESGKRPKADLSTVKPNSGGQAWITQPLVAMSSSSAAVGQQDSSGPASPAASSAGH
jgi:hypothetical protein